eukprot:TRINITY_DN2540_c0_g1_i10.p1 TRINITY_DN2540_c0_g1~~TRINITY_DN2540_c0_g1_i10.p1  ORF type:complete len:617 (+),score=127.96 TRINITY_DN2540_c0_g1_i10:2115-3965(+)
MPSPPTQPPAKRPSASPSAAPSKAPLPPGSPTESPRVSPPSQPPAPPAAAPTASPSASPSKAPLPPGSPTESPVMPPTASPSQPSTSGPSYAPPSKAPLPPGSPTQVPVSTAPSAAPAAVPSASPIPAPTKAPLPPGSPTESPRPAPTASPVVPVPPSAAPSKAPLPPGSPTESPRPPLVLPSASPQPAPTAAPYTAGNPSRSPVVTTGAPAAAGALPTASPYTAGSPSSSPVASSPTSSPAGPGGKTPTTASPSTLPVKPAATSQWRSGAVKAVDPKWKSVLADIQAFVTGLLALFAKLFDAGVTVRIMLLCPLDINNRSPGSDEVKACLVPSHQGVLQGKRHAAVLAGPFDERGVFFETLVSADTAANVDAAMTTMETEFKKGATDASSTVRQPKGSATPVTPVPFISKSGAVTYVTPTTEHHCKIVDGKCASGAAADSFDPDKDPFGVLAAPIEGDGPLETPAPAVEESGGSSALPIILVVVGVLGLGGLVGFYLMRKKQEEKHEQEQRKLQLLGKDPESTPRGGDDMVTTVELPQKGSPDEPPRSATPTGMEEGAEEPYDASPRQFSGGRGSGTPRPARAPRTAPRRASSRAPAQDMSHVLGYGKIVEQGVL